MSHRASPRPSRTSEVKRTVRGSVFGETLLRIIEIDGFHVEMTPQGTVLVIFNDDRPGVIGAVGTILGNHGINIGTMGVGQKLELQKAVLAVSLDKEPDAATIDGTQETRLRQRALRLHARLIVLSFLHTMESRPVAPPATGRGVFAQTECARWLRV